MKLIDNALFQRVGEFLGAVIEFCEDEKVKLYWAMGVLAVIGIGLGALAIKFDVEWVFWTGLILAAPGVLTFMNGDLNARIYLAESRRNNRW